MPRNSTTRPLGPTILIVADHYFDDGALMVENEEGGLYRINLKDHSVELISGEAVYGKTDWECTMARPRQGTRSILGVLLSLVSFL